MFQFSAHETAILSYFLVIFCTEKFLITFFNMIQAITRTMTLENAHFQTLKSFPVRVLIQFLIHTKTYDAIFFHENCKVIGNNNKS